MYNILHKYKSAFLFTIKLFIIGGAYYFISDKISSNKVLNSSEFLLSVKVNILNNHFVLLTIILFTISNWLLEIIKWKTLVSSIKTISFFESAKQSLSSLTASLLTPNRIGEYGAKAIYYTRNERSKIMLLNFLGNFSQMSITVIFGLFGLTFLINELSFNINFSVFQLSIIVLFFGLLFLVIPKKIWTKYLMKFITQVNTISNKIHFKNFQLSLLRYLVFSHQFYFLLVILGGDINYLTAMPIIFSMYFIASIIPGFVIFDWLIKGSVAIPLFSFFGVNEMIILSVTSIMWLLNFAVPSIIGSYYVLIFNKPSIGFVKENRIRT